jgi:serine/threonine protein kinase
VPQEIYGLLAPAQNTNELGRLGHYQVRSVLGAGGMGVVFQAFDPHLERLVALKAMLPAMAVSSSAKQRFLREAKAAAAIKHDHIVTVYQVGEERGVPFLAMEFLEGESLNECLQREGRLPVREVLRLAREIAEGLAAAHQHGLIHRDIKPANVWLETQGEGRVTRDAVTVTLPIAARPGCHGPRAKILDFGLARPTTDQAHLTQSGAIVGTPAFMAPEQVDGRTVDARSDLFSLGCVLYRMATGELPFKGKDTISILIGVATDNPRPPQELNPELPPALCALIERLLAKKPEDRPRSAAAVVDAIQAIDQGAAPGQQLAAKPRWPRRLLPAAALVAILTLVGYLCGPTILRYAANEGELVIVIDDPQVQALVDQTGVTIRDRAKDRDYQVDTGRRDLKTGTYMLEVTEVGGDLRLFTKEFTITRGGRTSVKITFDPKALADESAANAVSWAATGSKKLFADPAHALAGVLDFQDLVGATPTQFRDWLAGLGPDFRPSLVSSRRGTGATLFNAVAVRERKAQLVRFGADATDDEEQRSAKRMAYENRRVIGISCSAKGDQILASRLWVDDGLGYFAWGGTLQSITDAIERAKMNGWRPICLEGARAGDKQRYECVSAPEKSHKWKAFYTLSAEELLSTVQYYRQENWRPDVLSAHWDGSLFRFMLVLVDNDDAVDWRFRMDMSLQEYQTESARQKRLGLFPLALTSSGNEAQVRYAAVWVRYRVPGLSPPLSKPRPALAHTAADKAVCSKGNEAQVFVDPAHALTDVIDFCDLAGATPKQFHDWRAALAADFRLALLNSREEVGQPLLNAVAVREQRPQPIKFFPEMTQQEAERTWHQMCKDGFRNMLICDYTKQGQATPSQLWSKSPGSWYHWVGTLPFLVENINRDGRQPISLHAPAPSGGYRVTGADQPGRKWRIYYTLSADELLSTVSYFCDQGWRPDVLAPHSYEGQLCFMLVVVDNHDRVDWRFRMDMSLRDYKADSAEQRQQGLFPLALASYKENNEQTDGRYAAIWVRYRDARASAP